MKGAAVSALVLLAGTAAGAQSPPPAPSAPSSPIRITRLNTFFMQREPNGLPARTMECVTFVNDSPRVATHVRFVFAYEDAAGKTLGGDVLDRGGKFSQGARIEGTESSLEAFIIPYMGKLENCRRFGGAFDRDGNLHYLARDGTRAVVRTVRVFVETVDYADGEPWRAQPPFETLIGAPATVHQGEIASRADGGLNWNTPGGGPIEITHAHFFQAGFKQYECISFKNVSDKPVTSFQVRFVFRAADGTIAEDNTQTRTGTFGPGIENFGATDADYNQPATARLRNCWSYRSLRDVPAAIAITVPSVTFADGTTQTAP